MQRDDNVTPFRPRRSPQKRYAGGGGWKSPRGMVLAMHALTLSTFAVFFFGSGLVDWLALAIGVAALAIAAGRREEGMPWARTHHEMGLRTLVIGGAVWTLGSLLGIIPGLGVVVLAVQVGVCLWVLLRAGVGFGRGAMRLPMSNPRGPVL